MLGPLLFLAAGLGYGDIKIAEFERKAARDIDAQLQGENKKISVDAEVAGLLGAVQGRLTAVTIRASNFSTEGLPLFTETGKPGKGRIGNLRIILSNFYLSGLRVDYLEATIPGCEFDLGLAMKSRKIRLTQSGIGTGYVRLKQDDLVPFILSRVSEIKRVKLRAERGAVFVDGYGEFLVTTTDFSVIAQLAASSDGFQLNLERAKILLGWQRADALASKVLLDALNPVVDLRKDLHLYDAIKVRRLRASSGMIEAWGDTKIPNRPNKP